MSILKPIAYNKLHFDSRFVPEAVFKAMLYNWLIENPFYNIAYTTYFARA